MKLDALVNCSTLRVEPSPQAVRDRSVTFVVGPFVVDRPLPCRRYVIKMIQICTDYSIAVKADSEHALCVRSFKFNHTRHRLRNMYGDFSMTNN